MPSVSSSTRGPAFLSPSFDDGTIIGTGPVVGDRSTYSSGSPSGSSSATTSTATSRAAFEHLQQTIAPVDELLDLLAGQLATAGQLGQHPLAIRASFVHHLTTLLLGMGDLVLGIGGCVGTLPRHVRLRVLTQTIRLLVGIAQNLGGTLFGAHSNLRCRLASRLEHPKRLLAEEAAHRLFVELVGTAREPILRSRATRARGDVRGLSAD